MKRVSVNSLQSESVNEEAGLKLRHQRLLQDFLELQKVRLFFLNINIHCFDHVYFCSAIEVLLKYGFGILAIVI